MFLINGLFMFSFSKTLLTILISAGQLNSITYHNLFNILQTVISGQLCRSFDDIFTGMLHYISLLLTVAINLVSSLTNLSIPSNFVINCLCYDVRS